MQHKDFFKVDECSGETTFRFTKVFSPYRHHTKFPTDNYICFCVLSIEERRHASCVSVQSILTETLHMGKQSATWVPRMLTQGKQPMRQNRQNADTCLMRIVSQDKTWVHHSDPESNLQSKTMETFGIIPTKT